MRARFLVGPGALLLACGCGGGDAPASAVVVRDSAGIRIVENGLSKVPTIDLAGRELWEFSDHLFVHVRDGAVRADGVVAVSDIDGDEVLILDEEGTLRHVLGGLGQGPEDLSSPFTLAWLNGDTVLVQDFGNSRFSLFAGGEAVGTFRVPPWVAGSPILATIPGATRVVLDDWSYNPVSDEAWVKDEVHVFDWVTQAGDTIHEFDMARGVDDFTAPAEPFQPYGAAAARDSSLHTVRGDRAEIRRMDIEGRYVAAWRWTEAPPEVTDSIWDAWVEWRLGFGDSAPEEARREEISAARRLMSGILPYTSELLVDVEGRVWVGEYAHRGPPLRYRVFAPDGVYLADVRVPPRTEVFDIAADRLLAAVLDEFDVPTITLFDISEVPGR